MSFLKSTETRIAPEVFLGYLSSASVADLEVLDQRMTSSTSTGFSAGTGILSWSSNSLPHGYKESIGLVLRAKKGEVHENDAFDIVEERMRQALLRSTPRNMEDALKRFYLFEQNSDRLKEALLSSVTQSGKSMEQGDTSSAGGFNCLTMNEEKTLPEEKYRPSNIWNDFLSHRSDSRRRNTA